MKSWRARSSGSLGNVTTGPAAPLVVSVESDDVNPNSWKVTFNMPVTWSGGDGTFNPAGAAGDVGWSEQRDVDVVIFFAPDSAAGPGQPWDWTGADPTLSPVPDPTQSGVSI